eukprot:c34751_g1_i1.p1 GENE.c34751_g1_i1~~c34751_g1_i1.p1  ORF type:complete len:308 (+),score=-14.29 c34751_g1_i1:48-971(+)
MLASKIASKSIQLGWIGTGVMGKSMLEHCIKNGYKAPIIYNRSVDKTVTLQALGAIVANSPEEVAQKSDVVISIIGYPKDVKDVILGKVIPNLKPGSISVDMTTSEPSLAVEMALAAGKRGCYSVDAPVSGGDLGAKNAALSIMIGGEKTIVDALNPLFSVMGKNIVHMGPAGSGQHTKMANQILICTTMVGLVEGLLYAHKAGLDIQTVVKAISSGAAGSKSLELYAPRIIAGNYAPGFMVEHFVKDLSICLAEAKKMNMNLPGLKLAHDLYEKLLKNGGGKYGTQALMLALADMNGCANHFTPKL